jgi:hypothetical protein
MAEKDKDNLKPALGMTRRDLLRRGAVVGGTLLWATPVVQSIGGRAFAGHGAYDACCECEGGVGCSANHITREECEAFCSSAFGAGVAFYGEGDFDCNREGNNACLPRE